MTNMGEIAADMSALDDVNLTAIMRTEGIRRIVMNPDHLGGGFLVHLNIGGHAGEGETVGEALAAAKAKNADYLDMWKAKAA